MAFDEGPTLETRFEHACETAGALHPHWSLGDSYGGFTKALAQASPQIVTAIAQRLQRTLRFIAAPYWTVGRWTAFAVDGSRIETPHTAANEQGLGCAGRDKTAPQVFLTTFWHLGLGLPWNFRLGPGTDSERRHLEDMLDELPSESLVVADAGFVGFETCGRILAAGHSFLLRVGSNVTLLTKLGYHHEERDGLVYLWPQAHRHEEPLVLRLIKLTRGGQTISLLTNVLEPAALTDSEAAQLYERRWGIEVFYRSYKQTLDRRKMLSRTPTTCLLEAQWTFLGVWLLGLLTVQSLIRDGKDPRALSVAKARDTVRRAMRRAGNRQPHGSDLHAGLRRATQDSYRRHGSKTARNYPRKKREKPPGPPKIKPATSREIERAMRLWKKLHFAA